MDAFIRRHPVAAYFVITYVVSWLVVSPLVLDAQGIVTVPASWGWLHYLMSLGPITAAIVVTMIVSGRAGLAELGRRMVQWRMSALWWLAAVGSPFALFAAAMVGTRVVDGSWPDVGRLFEVNYLGNIGLWVLPLWIVTFGYGEETGWRGFALPRIQARHGALVSATLVALAWMGWHVVSFFYLPTYTQLGVQMIPAFFIGVLLGSIMLTWMYNGTGGSIFAVAMWHAVFDLFSASKAAEGTPQAVMTTLIVVWAIVIVWLTGPAHLSRGPKHVLAPA